MTRGVQWRSDLRLVAMSRDEANAYVVKHHRHHGADVGDLWRTGLLWRGVLVAVVMVGRPKAQALQQQGVVEVTRLCTDETPMAGTALLGAARRSALDRGIRRLCSYTRMDEPATVYRAAGWVPVAEVDGRDWVTGNKGSRWLPGIYEPTTETIDRVRWETGPDALPELAWLRHLGRRQKEAA